MSTIRLLLGDDAVINVLPDRITAVLEANRDEKDIHLVNCSVQQLLDFILEVEKNAIDKHVNSSTEKRQRV